MPLYFKQVVGLDLATSSYFSALPWATMAVSGVLAGTLADSLIARVGLALFTTLLQKRSLHAGIATAYCCCAKTRFN
jgi:hypothetical protein